MGGRYRSIGYLKRGLKSEVLRLQDVETGETVIGKLVTDDQPLEIARLRLTHESELLKLCQGVGVIEWRGLETLEGRTALLMADCGAERLREFIGTSEMTADRVLKIASRLADTLGRIHRLQVIHKDITPSNILWNPDTDDLRIIDFGSAVRQPRDRASFNDMAHVEGTLAYVSPEQTGRMNRGIDHRSDLYSLGVVLYELLIGRPPFVSEDPLGLIHSHLAQSPEPVHRLRPDLPLNLSMVIEKLLAKNAEDRYQSAEGLVVDLQWINERLGSPDTDEIFELGSEDLPIRFHRPNRLYGRETDLSHLLEVFER